VYFYIQNSFLDICEADSYKVAGVRCNVKQTMWHKTEKALISQIKDF